MNARKRAAAVVLAGVATATAWTGTATSAFAAGGSPTTETTPTVVTGPASTATKAKAPKVQLRDAQQSATAARSMRSTMAKPLTVTTPCYEYRNGTGDFCQWYSVNYTGSRGGLYGNDASLADNYFVTTGSGQNASMNRNTESDYNYDYYYTAFVATGSSYTGVVGNVRPRTGGNFGAPYKNGVQSMYWN